MLSVKPLRDEHAEATRNSLLAVARDLFTTQGYAATSVDQIAEAARLTKGAVYHHFQNKRDLFKSVYEDLAVEVASRIANVLADAEGPLDRACLGIEAFLACADDPHVRSIMFRDGTAVLAGECRRIDDRHYLRLLRSLLGDLSAAGLLVEVDTALLARLVLAMLIEASSILGTSDDVDASRVALRSALGSVLFGLVRRSP